MNQAQAIAEFSAVWSYCRDDIMLFCRMMNFDPWSQQAEALKCAEDLTHSDQSPKRMVVKAGTGVGKTALMVIIALWRHLRAKGTKTIVTAPTQRQCADVFFSELAGIMANAPPFMQQLIVLNRSRAHVVGYPEWSIISITANKETSAQGQHHKHMTILAEELSGIEDPILNAFLRTCSQQDNLFVGIGNPNFAQGMLFEAFNGRKAHWPNRFTLNKAVFAAEMPDVCDPRQIQSILDEFGLDSDMYRVGCLGEFPLAAGSCVIGSQVVREAMDRDPLGVMLKDGPKRVRRIGFDVARFGGDECVFAVRDGNSIIDYHAQAMDPLDAADLMLATTRSLGWDRDSFTVVLDATGMGQAVSSYLERAGIQVFEWHNAAKSPNTSYNRLMDSAWFEVRDKFNAGEIAIPYDEETFTQLVTRQYLYLPNQRIKVESKDDYLKRGYSSPDRAEALIMALSDHGDVASQIAFTAAGPSATNQTLYTPRQGGLIL